MSDHDVPEVDRTCPACSCPESAWVCGNAIRCRACGFTWTGLCVAFYGPSKQVLATWARPLDDLDESDNVQAEVTGWFERRARRPSEPAT